MQLNKCIYIYISKISEVKVGSGKKRKCSLRFVKTQRKRS